MFTGIIAGKGRIVRKVGAGGGLAFEVLADFDLVDPEEGESIAVCGVCLTAYAIDGRRFRADVSPETLSRTTLGSLSAGDAVNLERALRLSDRLGGHIVSGHVDCLAVVERREVAGAYTVFDFSFPSQYEKYVIEKGSICIDGVSLTVNSCGPARFSVSIIPHTLKMTSLGGLKVGSRVNIELDILGKYVEKLLSQGSRMGKADGKGSALNLGLLAENGFL
ncbi:MAG: riboflavin synthase [Deltaproteobacteria bacterium]|nr:MAG: riboflavin synthase [Deltaproteobacteria bacterium]PIE73788.1 MAG: riboflavin synthase [Deltaproteobacteria bacterium]